MTRWSREVRMVLRAQQGWKYITGREPEPKDGTPEKSNWLDINDQIVGALGTAIEVSLQRELETITNAKVAWDKLKEKMHAKGTIAKLEALTSTIWNCITSSIPASTTITKIKEFSPPCLKNQHPHERSGLLYYYLMHSQTESTTGCERIYLVL